MNIIVIFGLLCWCAADWGINFEAYDHSSIHYTPQFRETCFALTGTLSLGLFIHNAIITIMKQNRHQENNVGKKVLV